MMTTNIGIIIATRPITPPRTPPRTPTSVLEVDVGVLEVGALEVDVGVLEVGALEVDVGVWKVDRDVDWRGLALIDAAVSETLVVIEMLGNKELKPEDEGGEGLDMG